MARGKISVTDILMRQRAWVVAIPLSIALITGGIAGSHMLSFQSFQTQAVEADAVVQDKTVSTSTRRSTDGHRSTTRSYYVDVQYETQNGEVLTNTSQVSGGFHGDVEQGDRITVRYMPDDPHTVQVDTGRDFSGILFWSVPALLSAAVAVIIGRRIRLKCAAMLRAGQHGEERSATVTDHVGTKLRLGDTPMFWRLRWRDQAGDEGQSLAHDGQMLNRAAPRGSDIHVYVDPVTRQSFWETDIFGR